MKDSFIYINEERIKLSNTDEIQTIKVFPLKKVYVQKYEKYIDFNDQFFTALIDNYNQPTLSKPYGDKEHNLQEKYFDIVDVFKDYENEKFGPGLYAKIRLNEKGKKVIKENEYSYISPEVGPKVDTNGKRFNNVLWAITLTNIPALETENPTLQEQVQLIKFTKKEIAEMLIDYKKAIESFELKLSNDNVKPEDSKNVIDAGAMKTVLDTLKLAVKDIDKLTEEKKAMTEKNLELSKKLTGIEKEKLEKEKEDFFSGVLEKGQLEPGDLDDWKAQYDKDKDFVIKVLSKRDEKNDSNVKMTSSQQEKANGLGLKLSNDDLEVLKEMNIDINNMSDEDKEIVKKVFEEA